MMAIRAGRRRQPFKVSVTTRLVLLGLLFWSHFYLDM